jgi:hypothetical protein
MGVLTELLTGTHTHEVEHTVTHLCVVVLLTFLAFFSSRVYICVASVRGQGKDASQGEAVVPEELHNCYQVQKQR